MIRKAASADLESLARLGTLLWPHHSVQELREEFAPLLSRSDAQFFLLFHGQEPAGFAQCQLRRDYVEGTASSPVGYLEGIFVREGCRRRGYARALLEACQAWAAEQGCREFASDCELTNQESYRFHLAAGFAEAGRIICFTKALAPLPREGR